MKRIVTNLCMIHQHPKILLGMKKRGFGVGKWNGYGGKVKENESIEEALYREVEEEGQIKIKNPLKLGILEFEFPHTGELIENHIYKVKEFIGKPIETEEMRPEWFHTDEMPFKEMWLDDPFWIHMFLADKKFKGKFIFGKNEEILDYHLEEVDEI
jgi:8-oxo-dGTP diphosphatase / 2-hydroxy-dATP diphosphatase